ncbi:D-arabinono-1,4-lactone oxidase [Algiphilus aromaticivorans]|uniref:D-arabinono-1,4-lactone oxidase n=1 Tax=Algiphilus aromaticivorans TaxID=382454 RepID=UPI0005C1ED21|nr:D-arabinono-1,4-lactone oxidase [Algiphilus aromaticivorans]
MKPLRLVRRGIARRRAGGGEHAPRFITTPAVLEQIQREVAYAAETGSHLRVAGRGHTRAPMCRCDDGLLQLSRFTGLEEVDAVHGIVWVRAGTRMAQLARELAGYGMMLPTLGWPGNESIGGAVSIGSYGLGTGDNRHACPVVGLRMIGADGALFSIGAQEARLPVARVSLGTLGVLTHVGLRCVPATHMRARVARGSLSAALKRVEATRAHDYVEWYWHAHGDDIRIRTIDRRPRRPPSQRGRPLDSGAARLRSAALRLADALPQVSRRLPRRLIPERARVPKDVDAAYSWQLFADSSLGSLGYALPVSELGDVLESLGGVMRALDPRDRVLLRVRYICADDGALSPAYGQETAVVHLTAAEGAREHAEAAGEIFDRAGARPLWSMPVEHHAADLAARFPLWEDFATLRADLDPRGLFLNDYLAGLFGVSEP